MSWSNEQTSLLIDEYGKHPCLYVVKHKDYHNKNIRTLALQKIVDKVKLIRPLATEFEVQRKFLGLRTTYLNERKKVLASIRSGIREDEYYKPVLWYYHRLSFLDEHLSSRASKSNFEFVQAAEIEEREPEQQTKHEIREEYERDSELPLDVCVMEGDYDISEDGMLSTVSRDTTPRAHSPVPCSSRMKRKREIKITGKQKPENEILDEVSECFIKMAANVGKSKINKSEEEIFAEFVALQLKKIKSKDIKSDVQYEIHGLLRNALKKDTNL